jgi:hypothetical protein
VHLSDVVDGIVALLHSPPQAPCTVAFVGPRALALREYLRELRRALGVTGTLRVVPLPASIFRAAAAVAGRIPGSPLDGETAGMLLRGNAAAAGPFAQLLRREPRAVGEFIAPREAPALRAETLLGVWLPALRWALAALWVWTGVVSLGLYPVEASLGLLARVGLDGAVAQAALYGAAVLDLALGILAVAAPGRWRRAVWAAQALLVGAYTVLVSIFLPEYWLHPYGPVSKNLPLLAAIGLLWSLEPGRGRPQA